MIDTEPLLDDKQLNRGFNAVPIHSWIIESSLHGLPLEDLVTGFCERLTAAGLPLVRAFVAISTLHPLVKAHSFLWVPSGFGAEHDRLYHADSGSEAWRRSPFHHMIENKLPSLRQRLNGNEPPEFPVFAEFREQGMTDWLGMVFGFGFTLNGTWSMPVGMISSWAIDRPGGLTDAELDSLKPLVSTLALAVKGSSTLDIAQNVLRTYIGGDAAQHVLSGEIRRGSIVDLHAVLFYADLSGFTPLADATDSTTLVAWLDDYLDCMGGPVEAQGGQVLKFMGDGLLAIFPLDGAADVAATCRKALEAAAESMGRVVALNRARAAADQPTLGLDIALHVGHVAYGNVGTAERLDFTVIGPAVNEVARIENLCSSLQRPLLLSADFAQAAAASDDRLVSLGRHTLRGVREPKEIFGVETDCAELAVRSH